MTKSIICMLGLFFFSAGYGVVANETVRNSHQIQLDRLCEKARQHALAPMKNHIYQECMGKNRKEEVECAREAAGYNGNRIGGTPLYYDLPECEVAYKNRKTHMSTD